jgi:hypothetical protein
MKKIIKSGESGVAMIEGAITIVLFLTCFLAVSDLFFFAHTYLGLVNIAREAASVAAITNKGSSTRFVRTLPSPPTSSDHQDCVDNPYTTNRPCGSVMAQYRAEKILESSQLRAVTGSFRLEIEEHGDRYFTVRSFLQYPARFPLFISGEIEAAQSSRVAGVE